MTPAEITCENVAWEVIARRIESGRWRGAGLCAEVSALWGDYHIDWAMRHRMYRRIDQYLLTLRPRLLGFLWRYGLPPLWGWPAGEAAPRIAAARQFAKEAS